MLFNSYAFIFGFLPLALLVFYILIRLSFTRTALGWVVLASLFFYAYWNIVYVPLLVVSISINYLIGRRLEQPQPQSVKKWLLAAGVSLNLICLGYFKYANFFVDSLNHTIGMHWLVPQILLPLGISFFTFTQTAYLVDAYRGETKNYTFLTYSLFVTFFPHLIAGPILYHKDIIPQFNRLRDLPFSHENMAQGLMWFSIGLFKKTILADSLANWVAPVFDRPGDAGFIDAWVGALSYTFQLYFDFSGYSEMAIGLGLMFNVRLPLNFNSPYQATSIIDFWRRWHMTLASFLKNYLYIPLGGNRRGEARRMINILATMLLGGLWHGAGWTFVIWGGLHGVFLVINHAWRRLHVTLPGAVSWALTFGAVVAAWVIFRAHTLWDGLELLRTMAGFKGIALPTQYQALLEGLSTWGIRFADPPIFKHGADHLGGLLIYLALIILLPNTPQLMQRFTPNWRWAVFGGGAAAAGMLALNRVSEFLYFQF